MSAPDVGLRRAGEESRGRPAVPIDDPEAAARDICLRMLTARARSRAELASALSRRGIPAETAERVLSRFGEVGLIDDRAFAEAFVVSRRSTQGLARRALSAQLQQRGIDPAVASQALQGLDERADEAAARSLVSRRLASTVGREPAVRARRLVGMLARKGYAPALSYRVVQEALAAIGEEWEGPDPSPDVETDWWTSG